MSRFFMVQCVCIYFMDCWRLAFAFTYVAVDCLVLFVFYFMDTLVLIVIYRDFLCYLVDRPQGCNKPVLSYCTKLSRKTWPGRKNLIISDCKRVLYCKSNSTYHLNVNYYSHILLSTSLLFT